MICYTYLLKNTDPSTWPPPGIGLEFKHIRCDYLGGYKLVIKATVLVVNNSKGDNFVSLFSSHVLLNTPCRHSTNQSRVKYIKNNAKNIAGQKIVRALTKK
jgi:hypothetical protein